MLPRTGSGERIPEQEVQQLQAPERKLGLATKYGRSPASHRGPDLLASAGRRRKTRQPGELPSKERDERPLTRLPRRALELRLRLER